MECGCSIDLDFDEYHWAVEKFSNVELESSVVCTECGKQIPEGQQCESFLGLSQKGDVSVFFTCLDCLSIRATYFCSWCFTSIWEDLLEDISDNGVDAYLDGRLMKITPQARVDLLAELQRYICAGCGEELSCQDGENNDQDNPLCIDCLETQEAEKC